MKFTRISATEPKRSCSIVALKVACMRLGRFYSFPTLSFIHRNPNGDIRADVDEGCVGWCRDADGIFVDVTLRRPPQTIEIVFHEVSHCCDFYFRRPMGAGCEDSERRAKWFIAECDHLWSGASSYKAILSRLELDHRQLFDRHATEILTKVKLREQAEREGESNLLPWQKLNRILRNPASRNLSSHTNFPKG
jgi:hypothetical protein